MSTFNCPMCGYHYDPSEHLACQTCPLAKGCQLVCCPACGYVTVDPSRSAVARLTKKMSTLWRKAHES